MKIVQLTLIAATLLGAGTAASFAGDQDSPSARQQAENLWIATGDPIYGRLAGLTDAQINATKHMPPAQVELPSQD